MDGPEQGGATEPAGGWPAAVARLEARVETLERLAGLVDLLALPAMLAGGAAQLFDAGFDAADIPNDAPGAFPLERNGAGTAFRWLAFPGPFEMRVPVMAGIPARVTLVTLEMAHLTSLDAFVFGGTDGTTVTPLGLERRNGGLLAVSVRVEAPTMRLAALSVGCRTGLETGGRDARSLGLPFVKAQYRPDL